MSIRRTRLGAAVALAATLAALLSSALASHAQAVTIDYCSFADTPVTQMTADRAFRAIHCLTNRARAAAGVAPLAMNYTLVAAAQPEAQQAAQLRWWSPTNGAVSHINPTNGSTPAMRIKAAGYCPGGTATTGENTFTSSGVWAYPATPAGAVNWWLSDPPHRATMLSPAFRGEGVGVAIGLAVPGPVYNPAGTFVADFGACN
jgi:uncharacterized protein YkwD